MSEYRFSPLMQEMYQSIQDWLDENVEQMRGFREPMPNTKPFVEWNALVKEHLNSTDATKQIFSAAVMHHLIFPGHYFKTLHTMTTLVDKETFKDRILHHPYLFLIDIGCGGGAATIATLQILLDLHIELPKLRIRGTTVHCIASEPNHGSVLIFTKQLEFINSQLQDNGINVEVAICRDGIPSDIQRISDILETFRDKYNLPYLSHVLLFQVNLTKPFQDSYSKSQEGANFLAEFDIEADIPQEGFGEIYAKNYRALFENSNIDFLHIITISTDNYGLKDRTHEMCVEIEKAFGRGNHQNSKEIFDPQTIVLVNPAGSFWYDRMGAAAQGKPFEQRRPFHVAINTAINADLLNDNQLRSIKDVSNLEKAWVKVRAYGAQQALFDEIDMRLFELDLESNISRLYRELDSYVLEFIPAGYNDRYTYPQKIDHKLSSTRL